MCVSVLFIAPGKEIPLGREKAGDYVRMAVA
jgi:hypothetical protein